MRLAHFSDVHLLSLTGARWHHFANKRWIGGLNLIGNRSRHHRADIFDALVDDVNGQGADHVICTGDLTNVALPDEFRFARERFDRLRHGPDGATVIPGNHDAYVAAGVPYFDKYFRDFASADPEFRWPDGEVWPIVRVRGPLALIGLSTSAPTPWFTAYGTVGTAQLKRLRQLLLDERLAGKLRVIAVHHPPAGKASESFLHGLRDRAAFAAVIAECGADLVLHGHEHRDLREALPGPHGAAVPVHGIQSGTYESGHAGRRARYRLYQIDAAGERPRLTAAWLRVWSPAEGAFVADADSPELPFAFATAR